MKTTGFKLILLCCIIIFSFFVIKRFTQKSNTPSENTAQNTPKTSSTVKINDLVIPVEVADTPSKTTRGLSGRKNLDENSGMLFVFSKPAKPYFWMKEMNFDLDFIWIFEGNVIYLNENVPKPEPGLPEYKLPLYSPPSMISYVLEVNAGFVKDHQIKVGDSVEINY